MEEIYKQQVSLLLETLPYIAEKEAFAIKGGTALNLFYLDMPRLSVDIDLCYLPIQDRETTFKEIHQLLRELRTDLVKNLNCKVMLSSPLNNKSEVKLLVEKSGVQIKIEPNYILRGALFLPKKMKLSKKVSEIFRVEIESTCLDKDDLLGGKICAALDRQHPRDLFDIFIFLKNKEWTRGVTDAFIFYIISHNRPIHELLNPNLLAIQKIFEKEFSGMTSVGVTILQLEQARVHLIKELKERLGNADKEFLISVAKGRPDWNQVYDDKIKDLPSVKWKMLNINKMDTKKREIQVLALQSFFQS